MSSEIVVIICLVLILFVFFNPFWRGDKIQVKADIDDLKGIVIWEGRYAYEFRTEKLEEILRKEFVHFEEFDRVYSDDVGFDDIWNKQEQENENRR